MKNNLLGLPAIEALNLAVRLDAAEDYRSMIVRSYPKVFEGLGNLGEPYEIKLGPNPKPYALYTSRRVPLPLRDRVREELNRMESIGVISKVLEPSTWCAGMVADLESGEVFILAVQPEVFGAHH